MRGLNRSLWAHGRHLLSPDAGIQRGFRFNTVSATVSAAPSAQRRHRLQSTLIEKKDSENSEPPLSPSLAPSSVNESISTTSEISSTQEPKKSTQDKSRPLRTAYIAIGSNIGDRIVWIEKALELMRTSKWEMIIKRTSSLWETEPMYVTDQGRFLNGVIEIQTTLSPRRLLDQLQKIERILGRQKVQEKGPRNIDLDILLYENEKVETEKLIIPHLLMLEREFVLRPLAELIPNQELDPSQPGRTTADFLNALTPASPAMLSISYLASSSRYNTLKPLDSKRPTHVMGILNLTPDSFSDGGKHIPPTAVSPSKEENLPTEESQKKLNPGLKALKKFVRSFDVSYNPTFIIDVGGQSSAPGAPEVTAEEETSRVVETIRLIQQRYKQHVISIDTYRASVAEAAIAAGAHIVNDISAGQLDPEMIPTVARLGKTIVLMHMRGTPQTMTEFTDYEPLGLIPSIAKELLERVAEAEAAGIYRWRIILDPGIGFAKTAEQNLEILRRFDELRNWPGLKDFPWLVGSSRKNFIGKITKVEKPSERTWGSAVAVAAAIKGGADIVRVHDVADTVQVSRMADAIWRV